MSINLETATLAQLVAHFNALPGVTPVKKFSSKADAIKRIEAATVVEKTLTVDQLFDRPTEDGSVGKFVMTDNGPVWQDKVVEDAAVEGGEASVEPSTVEITDLEYRVLDAIAHSQWSPVNCATPTSIEETGTWYFADVMASETGLTEQQIGGVSTSLQSKGLIVIHIADDPKESTVDFTEAGFQAWMVNHDVKGTLPALETPPADAPSAPTASGFKYLTRDELKALAESNPEARAAYRMERRKAARAARKAKKSKAE